MKADSFNDKRSKDHKESIKVKNTRYNEENEEDLQYRNNPIEINSEDEDGIVKCIVPAPYQGKKKSSYFNPKAPIPHRGLNISLQQNQKDSLQVDPEEEKDRV